MPKRRSENGSTITNALDSVGNGGKMVGLLRLITPAGVIAIATICISIGSTLGGIHADIQRGCLNQADLARALQLEHQHDRYHDLFRSISVRCGK